MVCLRHICINTLHKGDNDDDDVDNNNNFYVHGSVHLESMSIIVQQNATMYIFIIFLQTALHVSDDTLIRHQEHIQNVITTSGTDRTVFATVR